MSSSTTNYGLVKPSPSDRIDISVLNGDLDILDAAVGTIARAGAGGGALPIPSVKDYGAVGDGTHDDTTAIQQAISGVLANSTILFPAGTYLVSSTIALNRCLTLQMEMGATLLLKAASNASVLSVSASGAVVTGGTINGNRTNQTTGYPAGITVTASNVTLSGVTINDSLGYGIHASAVHDLTITNCTITNSGYIGIFVEAGTPVSLDRIRVTGCKIDRSMIAIGNLVEGGLKIRGTGSVPMTNSILSRNEIALPVGDGPSASICIEAWYAPGVVISNNHLYGGSMGVSLARVEDAIVSNNYITTSYECGIELASSLQASVTGNTITGEGVLSVGILLDVAGGVGDSSYATIVSNTIRTCTSSSIQAGSAKYLSISGNTLHGVGDYTINLNGDCDYSALTGNTLNGSGTATKGVMVNSCTGVTITGNVIYNHTQDAVMLYSTRASPYVIAYTTITGNTLAGNANAISAQFSGGAAYGTNVKVSGNAGVVYDTQDLLHTLLVRTGTGTPENAVSAGVGSLFLNYGGSTGTTLYVKETGSGNTGWVAK